MPNSAVKPLILVVEDDPAVRNLIVAALEAHGLRHMAVETAHAAIAAAPDLEKAVRHSDVILTATPAREPFIKAEWVQPGTHISCVGADMSGKQEVDSALFASAKVFGDDTAQCLSVGECEVPYKAGVFSGHICEIGGVISGAEAGRTDASDITIFDSTGIALQDIATAAALLQAAQETGKGQTVTL